MLQQFAHAFAYHNIQNSRRYPAVAILCPSCLLRSIEFRRLKWAGVILRGDVRLTHEPIGSTAFVVHSLKNDKKRAQIWVFNDTCVIAMLQMLKDEHIRQLSGTPSINENARTAVLDRLICPDLTYRANNDVIKSDA